MRPLALLLLLAAPLVAAPVPKSIKKRSQSLDGYWLLTEVIENGTPRELGNNFLRHTVIEGERYACTSHGRPNPSAGVEFTVIDPDRPLVRKWGGLVAVFEIDGDTLRSCFRTGEGKEVPECKPGPGVTYYVYERVKE